MERTRVEIEALIPSLPLRKLSINGKDRLLRYDEASRMAYMVEDDGITYTGNCAPLREKEPSTDGPEKAAVKESSPDDAKGKNGKPNKKEKPPKPKKIKKEKPKKSDAPSESDDYETKKKKALLFIAAIAVGLIAIVILSNTKRTPKPTASGQDAPLETVDVAALAAAEKYECLVVTRNMYQGEEITEKDLATCVLTKVEYAQCGGVYPVSCKGNVVGMHMTKFLPFGALLGYDACTFDDGYSRSPWSVTDDSHTYLDIPYSFDISHLDDFIPGDYVRLVITRDTQSKTTDRPEGNSTGGMEHSTQVSASITTDVFTFERIQIADFILPNNISGYSSNSRFFSVPQGFLGSVIENEFTAENYTSILPEKLRVVVTKEQANVIGKLPPESIKVEMRFVESAPEDHIADYNQITSLLNKYLIARYRQVEKQLQEEAKNK